MNIGGDGNNLRELKHQLQGETKGDVDTTAVGGDFKVHDPEGNIKYRCEGARQAPPAALQTSQQQQSQGTVCWERFLHIRSLKVLLVETDYSTRHVVTALLRNCSYEVTEAANGFQAWKILEDPTNQIDLVLTEVVMPGLNGIGLLHKIMSHKTRNNVPVIMMSSHDSMGIVFKCLSKGAVDFLVKPIRKNELKNLWQHVWRRCHSSSGSGSESGTQTQKSVQSKGVEKSDNDSGSNDEYENGSMGLNVGDGSDTGSGTQSSWTKQAVDMNSPLSATVEDQVAECPDSTCAQVIHSTAELSGNKHASVIGVKMCGGCKENTDDATCNDQERVVGNVDLKFIHIVEDTTKLVGTKEKHILEKGSGKLKEKIDKVNLDLNSEAPQHTLNCAASITGSNANTNGPITKNTGTETSLRQSNVSDAKAKPLNDVKDAPSHEHDLKRLREGNDVGTAVLEDRNVLRRSDSSAFSRYNASANGNKAPGVNIQSGSPDSAIDKPKEKSVCDLQSQSNGDHRNQSSNIDMGSTTNRTTPGSATLQNNSTVSSVKHLHPSSVFQPSKGVIFATQLIQSKQADDEAIRNMLVQSSDMFQDSLSQCLAHNCNHRDVQQQPEPPTDHHGASLEKITAAIPPCATGFSNGFGGPVEGTAGNYYSANNGSASGSNHGSNEQNGSNGQYGSSTVVNTGGVNLESDNGVAGKGGSGSGDGSGSGNENRLDQNKASQREAALTKFRQKRKERCFRKKVRYQSRKRLAEQRPRVRGQFVRQIANESSSNGTEGS